MDTPLVSPCVFFAYTRGGEQFDSIEALYADAAYADIARIYREQGATEVDLEGFYVLATAIAPAVHREVKYWSNRFAECADADGPNAKWVITQLGTALDAMNLGGDRPLYRFAGRL